MGKKKNREVTGASQIALDDIAKEVQPSVLEQILRIVELQKQGVPKKKIQNELSISKATFYRRKEKLREIANARNKPNEDEVLDQITDTMAFYKEVRSTAMSISTISKKFSDRTRAIRIALEAEKQLASFLHQIGFFEEHKAKERIRARQMLYEFVNNEQITTNLRLLDEVQLLKENLEALEQGKPKPHDLSNSPDWSKEIGEISNDARETSETNTDNEYDRFLH